MCICLIVTLNINGNNNNEQRSLYALWDENKREVIVKRDVK